MHRNPVKLIEFLSMELEQTQTRKSCIWSMPHIKYLGICPKQFLLPLHNPHLLPAYRTADRIDQNIWAIVCIH